MLKTLLFCGVFIFFAGCLATTPSNQAAPTTPAQNPPAATPAFTATPLVVTTPMISPEAGLPFVKIDFIKSGGISGAYRRQVMVSKDGTVYVDDNGRAWTKALSHGEFISLADSLKSSGFYEFVATNLATCPDAFDYYLVVEVGDKKRKFEKGGYCPGSAAAVDRAATLVESLAG